MGHFSAQTVRAFVPDEQRRYEPALVYDAVFTARQCDRIVEQASSLAIDPARVGTNEDDYELVDEVRQAHIAWIPADEPYVWIHDKLTSVVQKANRTYGYDLIGFTEDLQFTEYAGAGAFYDWHQDGLDGDLAGRKLSLVVQLSDPADYDGGDLELFGVDGDGGSMDLDEWRPRVRGHGSVVVFPAFEFHRVTPLTAGTRRSLVCWVGGPPFR